MQEVLTLLRRLSRRFQVYRQYLLDERESAVAVQKVEAAVQNYRMLVDKCPEIRSSRMRSPSGLAVAKQETWSRRLLGSIRWPGFPKDRWHRRRSTPPFAVRVLAERCRFARLTALLTHRKRGGWTLYQRHGKVRAKNPRPVRRWMSTRAVSNDARRLRCSIGALQWPVRPVSGRAEKLFRACLATSPPKGRTRGDAGFGFLLREDGRNEEGRGSSRRYWMRRLPKGSVLTVWHGSRSFSWGKTVGCCN